MNLPLPLLVAGALVVLAILLLATGGHLPLPSLGGPSTTTSAPAPTGQSWDSALVDLALSLTTRLLMAVPLLLVVVGFLHLTHVWAHHARPLLIRIVIGAAILLFVPVLIVLLPHILQFRDHIVSELVHG